MNQFLGFNFVASLAGSHLAGLTTAPDVVHLLQWQARSFALIAAPSGSV